jgi:hypothetical protein
MGSRWLSLWLVTAAAAGLGCGGEAPSEPVEGRLLVEERDGVQLAARYLAGGEALELSSRGTGPLAGHVVIGAGAVSLDMYYDFAAREVVADGHDGALDRHTHGLLRNAAVHVAKELAPPQSSREASPLHEQMLTAGMVLLADSGGMPVPRLVFALDAAATGPSQALATPAAPKGDVDKSLGNDGVACVDRGSIHAVSFDDANGTWLDQEVSVDAEDCNGKCGPGCASLTPWAMWTLDCLEHDRCCGANDVGALCWTPLGQCGDEYVDAELDFLRGYDPLSRHCGG